MKKGNLSRIQKRDGRTVKFNANKITQAMFKAFMATGEVDGIKKSLTEAKRLTPIAVDLFSRTVNGESPSVELMQDVVEQVLMAAGHYKTAKAYILYRAEHKQARKIRQLLGIEDDLGLSLNQVKVLEKRYLRHDEEGKVVETPRQLFSRVAKAIAGNEKRKQKDWEKIFLEIMVNMEFMPAGCYLRSAGIKNGMLANCFVLPVEDSMEGIFNAVKWMALIHQKGGGTGFNFSKLRPKGDYVTTSGGFSSGPVSFMKVFDAATRQVMQGGYRQGANMGILNVDHPDILDFISCKTEEHEVNNFNISVGVTEAFMQAVEKNKDFALINHRTGEVVQIVSARGLFNQIATLAWRIGDPGIIFLDTINKNNPVLKTLGPMTATNVCGEQPLHPFDVCNLGSVNLASLVKEKAQTEKTDARVSWAQVLKLIKWQRLKEVVRSAVRFLDNGIDASAYPIAQVVQMARANRRIGLGVMGWADMLYQLELPYNSHLALKLAGKIMKFINQEAHDESERLAQEKGIFPNWKGSRYEKKGLQQRNVAVTTIAPTGTISMVAECSSGIEPVFALSYVKNVVEEQGLAYVNPYFQTAVEKYIVNEQKRQQILDEVIRSGSCQKVKSLSKRIKQVFLTAHEMAWQDHIRMQAAFQKCTDNAVSKTINFPNNATIDEVAAAYMLAWKLGCKGLTIYRDGSRSAQILKSQEKEEVISQYEPIIQSKVFVKPLKQRIEENNSSHPKCPECGGEMQMSEGCSTCLECGFAQCSL